MISTVFIDLAPVAVALVLIIALIEWALRMVIYAVVSVATRYRNTVVSRDTRLSVSSKVRLTGTGIGKTLCSRSAIGLSGAATAL